MSKHNGFEYLYKITKWVREFNDKNMYEGNGIVHEYVFCKDMTFKRSDSTPNTQMFDNIHDAILSAKLAFKTDLCVLGSEEIIFYEYKGAHCCDLGQIVEVKQINNI